MSATALAFMATVWTIVIGAAGYTLMQIIKHSKE